MFNWKVLVVAALLGSLVGCHTTGVQTRSPNRGAVVEDQQWFTMAGSVPLSSPAKCDGELLSSESGLGPQDVFTAVLASGLALGAGYAVCASGDEDFGSCLGVGLSVAPFGSALFSSRTVRYNCSTSGSSLGFGANLNLPVGSLCKGYAECASAHCVDNVCTSSADSAPVPHRAPGSRAFPAGYLCKAHGECASGRCLEKKCQ